MKKVHRLGILLALAIAFQWIPTQTKACNNTSLQLDSVVALPGGMYKLWMTACIGGGFNIPNTPGANAYTMDFYFEVFGQGVTIMQNTQSNQYYPDFLNSGQNPVGCTNCRNACVTYGSLGAHWPDPSCTDVSAPFNDTTCYGCGGPQNASDCPQTVACPNGAGTCLWYSANDPCCNGGTAASGCNAPGYNYFSFWGQPFKPSTCPGPPNSGNGCRNWVYTDIYNGSGPQGPYCDTFYVVVNGCPDSVAMRGTEGGGAFGTGCITTATVVDSIICPLDTCDAKWGWAFDTAGCPIVNFFDSSTVNIGTIVQWNWDFGDGNSSSQQNPQHTYATNGTYNVCLTIMSVDSCRDTICDSVPINCPPNSRIFSVNSLVKVFPNPARDIVTIKNNLGSSITFEVFDIYGRKVMRRRVGGRVAKLNLDKLDDGVYYYRATSLSGMQAKGKLLLIR